MIDYIKQIEFYQHSNVFHPFTCGNDSRHKLLKPTIRNGKIRLECIDCEYTQENIPDIPFSLEELQERAFTSFSVENLKEGVQIIVLNEKGQILIAKRSPFKYNKKPRIGACRWNLIGGKVDKGETNLIAAIRELKEEANIKISGKDLIELKTEINEWDTRYDPFIATLYICTINKEMEKNIELNDEHTEFKFISLKKLNKYNLLGYTKFNIQKEISRI